MNSKLLIRVIPVILALVTLLSFTACNKPSGGEAPTDAPETPTHSTETPTDGGEIPTQPEGEEWLDLPADTYGDDEFSILFSNDPRYSGAIVLDELSGQPTSVERAVYERMTYISDTYKIKFQIYRADDFDTDLVSKMSTYAKTGTDAMDLCSAHGRYAAFPSAIQGLLYEWHGMDLLDLDASYWSRDAKEQLATPGGKLYFMTGDANYLTVGSAFCMFFNKDIIEGINGLEQPFRAVRDGEWTLETLETYVSTVKSNMNGDGSGVLGQDFFGYAAIYTRGPLCAINSTDYGMLERDAKQEYGYKFTGRKEIVDRAVSDYVELVLKSGNAYYYKSSSGGTKLNVHNAFIGETVCFIEEEVDYAGTFAKSGVNFGILPWPMYENEESEKGYTSLVDAGIDLFCVLINTTDANLQRISVVLENLAYYGQRDVMPLYYETVLSYQYIKDQDSLEMLGYIHDSLTYDFAFFYNPGGLGDAAMKILNAGGTQSLSSWIDGVEGAINSDLQKWFDLDDKD